MTTFEKIRAEIAEKIDYNNGMISIESVLQIINKYAEQELCEDCISRKSIKQKLQEHHDFFINAYDGFSNLSLPDKSRVDEITNCIAMVVNEPSVNPQPKTGHWIEYEIKDTCRWLTCSVCGYEWVNKKENFCPNCGRRMIEPQESEEV